MFPSATHSHRGCKNNKNNLQKIRWQRIRFFFQKSIDIEIFFVFLPKFKKLKNLG